MTVENAQAGFRGTGLFPVNPGAINPSAFAPSRTTERTLDLNGPQIGDGCSTPASEQLASDDVNQQDLDVSVSVQV